ncbi:class I SAM-dependent methyltransferase [Sphingomonas solaris]|uniref:Class I SAM-dependent methyltransferase n=1 Tax=Alterirhizorhabdus solaris TaxID=2529389 RepID=A0A558RAK4_9SPHN|nr:methyltransferase domain-containing protein [Sphingomonas solaris]TVV76322.1 class I SAM-dependent methyltransferase [Sphingomonas solaris]
MNVWRSPVSGAALAADTPWSLDDGRGERWPVVDGIPYLRIGREALVADTLRLLDAGEADAATALLLADQDDWWTGPAADPADLARLVRERDTLTLREAMALLRLGPVADYFAHRWVDPTYLAGLALIEAHWQAPARAFELACGIGHYLRALTGRGVACMGGDVVFAKCWLARHWVAPAADYVVFDAGGHWPLADDRFDLAMCHDAFYFLPEQAHVAACLRVTLAEGGVLAISHLHNADYRDGAKGPARSATAWRALFPDAVVYDERALLAAILHPRAPAAIGWRDDPAIEAWSLVEGGGAARVPENGVAMPPADAMLRPNPLLDAPGGVRWPSDRWRDEYGAGCRWALADEALPYPPDPVRLRRLVDLPARW